MDTCDLQASQRLGHIIRRVGHDLRNKLSVMTNSTYYLNMKVGGQTDRLDRHLHIVSREIDVCNRMIVDLMDIAAPKPPLPSPVNINALVQRVASQIHAPEGVQVKESLSPDLPLLQLDSEQLERVIGNILSYQYATLREGDTLRLISRTNGAQIHIEFIDSGPGLDKETAAHILDAQDPDGFSSSLMGLLVARHLASLNKACLEVESRKGIGTRFGLIFPHDLAAAPNPRVLAPR